MTEATADERTQPQSYGEATSIVAGTFAMTAYMVFDQVGSASSYPVEFAPSAQFEFYNSMANLYWLHLKPVTIDLVAATACPTCADAPTRFMP